MNNAHKRQYKKKLKTVKIKKIIYFLLAAVMLYGLIESLRLTITGYKIENAFIAIPGLFYIALFLLLFIGAALNCRRHAKNQAEMEEKEEAIENALNNAIREKENINNK